MKRAADHNNGIVLTFVRSDNDWFQTFVFDRATGIFFIRKRLYFHYIDGSRAAHNSGGPSCLISYGRQCLSILENINIPGKLVKL